MLETVKFVHYKIPGADVSCINAVHFQEIQNRHEVKQVESVTKHQFKAAGGQALKAKGQYEIPISYENTTFHHPFFIIDGLSEPMIVGIDLIQKHHHRYCPTSHDFSWGSSQSAWKNGVLKVCKAIKLQMLQQYNLKSHSENGPWSSYPGCPLASPSQ
jgi:hypothetical protein